MGRFQEVASLKPGPLWQRQDRPPGNNTRSYLPPFPTPKPPPAISCGPMAWGAVRVMTSARCLTPAKLPVRVEWHEWLKTRA